MTVPVIAAVVSAAAVLFASPAGRAPETFVSGPALGMQIDAKASGALGPEFNDMVSRVFDIAQWYGCMYMGALITGLGSLGPTATCQQLARYVRTAEGAVTEEINASGARAGLKASLYDLRNDTFRILRNTYEPLCRDGRVNVAELRARLTAVQGAVCYSLVAPQGLTPIVSTPAAITKVTATPMPAGRTTPAPTSKPGDARAPAQPTPVPTPFQKGVTVAARQAALAATKEGSLEHYQARAALEAARAVALLSQAVTAEAMAGIARNRANATRNAANIAAANKVYDAVVKATGDARRFVAAAGTASRSAAAAKAVAVASAAATAAAAETKKTEVAVARAVALAKPKK